MILKLLHLGLMISSIFLYSRSEYLLVELKSQTNAVNIINPGSIPKPPTPGTNSSIQPEQPILMKNGRIIR